MLLSVTIGSILEWYEIYLYIYWAPILSKLFFPEHSPISALIHTLVIFAVGFLGRPIGGLIFGRIGDLKGRKTSLIRSIFLILFPTFFMGVLPSHESIGISSPILFGILRFLQSLPAGGELPGAFCFLFESAHKERRRYLTSWAGVGGQIGVIISMIECFYLEKFLSPEALILWGWRVSFILGGAIGLFGLLLRYHLHETPVFKEIETKQELTRKTIPSILWNYKQKILIGIGFGLLNSVGYYIISILFPIYFSQILSVSYQNNLMYSLILMFLITAPIPFVGYLGDRWDNKKFLLSSTLICIGLLYPIYRLSEAGASLWLSILGVLFVLNFSVFLGLIPYRFASLFPAAVRVTCVGFSFNIVDGVIGGFIPVMALFLVKHFQSISPFYWILLGCAFVSFLAFLTIREEVPSSK